MNNYIDDARETIVTGQTGTLRERMVARDAGVPIDRSHVRAEQLLGDAQSVELPYGVTIERTSEGGVSMRTLDLRALMAKPSPDEDAARARTTAPAPHDATHIVNPFAKESP